MRTVVHFRTGDGRYCVPIESTIAVRRADGLLPLPEVRAGVVGVLPDEQPITVLSVLGAGRDHVLVLGAGQHRFGLLVEEVTGLGSIDEADIGLAPDGQAVELISGVIHGPDGLVLLADPEVLATRLA